ncbi:hypothetical protein SB49_15720 [Sediminicola sp. YIK13]|uniref:hypothetical protein n=1 Tax=Sediminicola sp. YIK13 TaxID=1453352 RepID=UPI00071F1266|nr:hypothetical protein [Sediminicola sp. YIK13]ALM09075.1 hypothetical protein SB49_15720 [Sediminicola sp. YIK13]
MKSKILYILIFLGGVSCQKNIKTQVDKPMLRFEKIKYFKLKTIIDTVPFKYRLTYYFDNGKPARWLELDSLGLVMTDYIYEYDDTWTQIGARYREEGASEFSIEKVRFENDSTMVTEWIDSIGKVYYTMKDHLNKQKKTYRAEFIGDKTHGYDSTFYTKEGFKKRIFFTNTKGKIFNDRRFIYDSINTYNDWVLRQKIMEDPIREIQSREVHYDNRFVSDDGKFYEGIISTGELSENVISFSKDQSVLFLTRTSGWTNQSASIAHLKNGLFTETVAINELDSIYNGAISPSGNKIIYSIREGKQEEIYLIEKIGDTWSNTINLSESSGIKGGYFYWLTESKIYFQTTLNEGDIVLGKLENGKLIIQDSLTALNTKKGTEFSPYVDKDKRFIIFTRYVEGDKSNQGFFVTYNENNFNNPKWGTPTKLKMLPYGWGAFVINNENQFVYTNGEDFFSIPMDRLNLSIK